MTNDWIYKLHIAIWLKKVSNDRLFANLQFCDFLIKVSYCSVHYRLHCTAFTRTHRQQFFKKDVKWLNLQTSHCNLTEKCLKWQTSFYFWQKLLTTVSTSVSAAAAFIRTRGQQFLQMFDVLDGHFDNFSFFNPPTTFFEIIWRYQMGKVGQTTIHSITPPFFNNFVGQRILRKKW